MDDLATMRSDVNRLQRQLQLALQRLDAVATTVTKKVAATLGSIDNFLRNSDLSWSKDAYVNAVLVGGDTAKEAAHFYTHVATRSKSDYVVTDASPNVSSVTETFTADDVGNFFTLSGGSTVPAGTTVQTFTDAHNIVLSNNVTTTGTGRMGTIIRSKLVEDSAHALSSTGHTVNNPGGAADPQWNKVDGLIEWGSTKSIDCPLPRKMGQPSKNIYVIFVARKRTSSIVIPAGLKLGIGFHDNTAGQRKYLEGGQFALRPTVVGVPGATVDRKYKVIDTTDWGDTYETPEMDVAAAPSDASYGPGVYVSLNWDQVVGVTHSDIYRNTGGVYVLAGQIFNGGLTFNEQNNPLKTVGGYPATGGTNSRAYLTILIDNLTAAWQGYIAVVPVPGTYNSANTTDKQWFRLSLSQALAAGSEQGIQIDKIGVSWGFGNWANAPDDANAQHDVDTSGASGSQGGSGTGGGGVDPGPGRGGLCVWTEALIQCYEAGSRMRCEKAAREVTIDDLLVSIDEQGDVCAEEIADILDGWTSRLHTITAENGAQIPCSPSHPIIQCVKDCHGKPASLLRKDAAILTLKLADERAQQSSVAAWEFIDGLFPVRMFRLKSGRHLFVAGSVVCHNIKLN